MNTYRNKNLVYVDNKGYTEKDLREMIQFYQQNYKPDITLPQGWNSDVSGQIFKNYPFYQSISKQTYYPELYYEKNCDKDITFREFLSYIEKKQPKKFLIFSFNEYKDVGLHIRIGLVFKNGDNYTYNDYYLDKDENMVNVGEPYNADFDKMIEFIIGEYGNVHKLYYDLYAVKKIYKQRQQCISFNKHYEIDMLQNYFNNLFIYMTNIEDIDTFILYYSTYLFLLLNINISDDMNNTIDEFIALLDDGIPDNINDLREMMKPYKIKNNKDSFEIIHPDYTSIEVVYTKF